MKSTSSFLVSKLSAESLLPSLTDAAVLLKRVKMVETVYDLSQPSVFTTGFKGSSFVFPLGNLLLCDRKHESANPTRAISQKNRTPLSPFVKPIKISRRLSSFVKPNMPHASVSVRQTNQKS